MNIGIGLALLCAAVTQLGLPVQAPRRHAGAARGAARAAAQRACPVSLEWFALGMAIAVGAWILHVAALALAPLSVVQVVLSTGVVMLAVLGERLFGCTVGGRQWAGVVMTAGGLTLLVLTLPRTGGGHAAFAVPALVAFEAGMLALGALLIAAPRLGAPAHHHGAVLGAAAGTLFGVSDVALKALTGVRRRRSRSSPPRGCRSRCWPPCSPSSPPPAASSRATPSRSSPAPRRPRTSPCIGGGILVFGDALAGGVLLGVQIAAFALVAVAALVTPHGRRSPPRPPRRR